MQIISSKCNVIDIPREWKRAPLELDAEAKLTAEPDGAVAVHVRRKPRLLPMLFKGKFRRLGRLDSDVELLVRPLLEVRTPLRVRLVDVPAVFLRVRDPKSTFAVSIWAAVGPGFCRTTCAASASAQHRAARQGPAAASAPLGAHERAAGGAGQAFVLKLRNNFRRCPELLDCPLAGKLVNGPGIESGW